jgi:HEPN domain-containing protein
MSQTKNRAESKRWLATAIDDLETAEILLERAKYAQACFYSQQTAEKALKALYFRKGEDPWGHSVKKLISQIAHFDTDLYQKISSLEECGAFLDRFYIPTRYPNGLPDITPAEAYSMSDAQDACNRARKILEKIKSLISEQ